MPANAPRELQRTESAPDHVYCHSGHIYADYPTAIVYRGQKQQVVEILDRWQIPGARYFRVRVDDDAIFELSYVETSDEWQIITH